MGHPEHSRPTWSKVEYSRSGTDHLLIDGLLSHGSDDPEHPIAAKHIAEEHVRFLASRGLPGSSRAKGHTYHRYRVARHLRGYIGWDTLDRIDAHVDHLFGVLLSRRRGSWVITAFSLSAPIAVLATHRLLQTPGQERKVRRLILVTPALFEVDWLSNSETRIKILGDGTPFGRNLPDLAMDFETPAERCADARAALVDLLDAGIDVTIIYSPNDGVAAFKQVIDPRIYHWAIPAEPRELQSAAYPVTVHFGASSVAAHHHLIHELQSPFIV
jgi:hypothetical protein